MESEELNKKQEWGLPSIGVPAEILFNPLFSNSEKILYGFLRNLSSQPRGCFATNNYLGRLVGMKKNSVSRAIAKLKQAKYISIEEEIYNGFKRRVIRTKNVLEYYQPLIHLVYQKIKENIDYLNDSECIGLSYSLTGLSSEVMGVILQEYPPTHTGVPPYSYRSTNEYDNKDDSKLDIKKDNKQDSLESCPTGESLFIKEEDDINALEYNNIQDDTSPLYVSQRKAEKELSRESPPNRQRPKESLTIEPPKEKASPKAEKKDRADISPKYVDKVLDLWMALGFRKHKKGSKTYNRVYICLKGLRAGNFFNGQEEYREYFDHIFTRDEINESLRNFSLAAFNYDYKPEIGDYKKYLGSIDFDKFVYNSRTANSPKSLFIHYLENKPERVADSLQLIKDPDERLTEIVKSVFIERILGGAKPEKWTSKDENNFRLCSRKILTFFENNGNKVNAGLLSRTRPREVVDVLFDSLLADSGEGIVITSGWICSPRLFNSVFPQYLNRMGIIGG